MEGLLRMFEVEIFDALDILTQDFRMVIYLNALMYLL